MRIFLLGSACLAAALFFLLPTASTQDMPAVAAPDAEARVTVRTHRRGFPRVNFTDGKEIGTNAEARRGSPAKRMVAADFDSDGMPDLVTVDASGVVGFHAGRREMLFPNSDAEAALAADGASPFTAAAAKFQMSIAPDFLETGDFNADGHADLIAAVRGGTSMYVSVGDGGGNFAHTTEFALPGAVTALGVGEIGRADGQADVAVSVAVSGGASLIVFEHPAGAFARDPEVIPLDSAASHIALGYLDGDGFADIVLASGSDLTLVRGRGQVHPWDIVDGENLQRPAPVVQSRKMPFEIAAIASGRFTERRGESLALLSSAGEIATLDLRPERKPARRPDVSRLAKLDAPQPLANGKGRFSKFRKYDEPLRRVTDEAELLEYPQLVPGGVKDIEAYRRELAEKRRAHREKMAPEARAALEAKEQKRAAIGKGRARANFIRSISPAPAADFAEWNVAAIFADARLAAAAGSLRSGTGGAFVRVRVSDSGRDELAVADPASGQLHLLIRENPRRSKDPRANELVSFDTEAPAAAILPMRLNMDALSDLVVLTEGSALPSVVMTAPSAVFTVTTLSDEDDGSCGPSCSLREAIEAANLSPGTDTIEFAVSGLIQPFSQLPTIESPMTINGTNAPVPQVEVLGNVSPIGASGIPINAPNVVVRRLSVTGFRRYQPDPEESATYGGHGITVFNYEFDPYAEYCIIEGNYLGTSLGGTTDRGNEASGLQIYDSDDNTIGGTTDAARNVISGNGNGTVRDNPISAPGVSIIDGRFTILRGNYIGLNALGSGPLPNSSGVYAAGSNNEYGGDAAGSRNVISGNRHLYTIPYDPNGCYGTGISEASVISESTGEWVTHDNNIKGNRIGTNPAGTAAMGNCRTGIYTSPRHATIIGSITANGRNLTSGNDEGGIYCTRNPPLTVIPYGNVFGRPTGDDDEEDPAPEGSCTIRGNTSGTDATGSYAIPNSYNHLFLQEGMNWLNLGGNIAIDNTDSYSVLGDPAGTSSTGCTGFCNLASGQRTTVPEAIAWDVGLQGDGRGSIAIFNNYSGVNASGTSAIPNGTIGMVADAGDSEYYTGASVYVGGYASGPGGTFTSLGNLVSGNTGTGISISPNRVPDVVIVRTNLIGTDRTGNNAIPNGNGLAIAGGGIVIVGGPVAGEGNVISGNTGWGIHFQSFDVSSTRTVQNLIGVNRSGQPLGNGGDGVVLSGDYNYIGDIDSPNIIANNGGAGVLVRRFNAFSQNPAGNRIAHNSIFNNGGLGIDISADTTNPVEADGVTENDCGDDDSGPHGLQNFPVLTAPVFNGDGTVTVGGAFGSRPSAAFTIDFYTSTAADPSGYGEGQTHIGSADITTDAGGIASFMWTSNATVAPNALITATATDANGNTSEFSCIAGQCSIFGANIEEQMRSAVEKAKAPSAGCTLGFEVNVTTDDPDPNPADGICDADLSTVGPQCSLRAAIQTANASEGADFVRFNIPGSGIQRITPASSLPAITSTIYLDATTQPGYTNMPLVEVIGTGLGTGLELAAGSGGSSISGLAINRFYEGIEIASDGNTIEHCFIGMDADGFTIPPLPSGRQLYGISVTGKNNTIGSERSGPDDIGSNFIHGNDGAGVQIKGEGATGNKVIGSIFGRTFDDSDDDDTDSVALDAVLITDGASNNTIGGTRPGEANFITTAITCVTIEEGAHHNFVTHNLITQCFDGVSIIGASDNTIGGTIANGERNTIIDNEYGIRVGPDTNGLHLKRSVKRADGRPDPRWLHRISSPAGGATAENKIYGNVIGLTATYIFSGNDYGIVVANAQNTQIGTGDFGQHNFIGNSNFDGIVLTDQAVGTKILGNFIGTDISGQSIAANGNGILIAGSGSEVRNNIISGNNDAGIQIAVETTTSPVPTGNLISNNTVGTNGAGTHPIPNGTTGIQVFGNQNSVTSNTVSGNEYFGIDVRGNTNSLLNNKVGTNSDGTAAIGNGRSGIRASGTGNIIRSNVVSGNQDGIALTPDPDDPTPISGNTIDANIVGLNAAATAAIPNQRVGIGLIGASANHITGNTSAGNTGTGITLQQSSNNNVVRGNFVGVTQAGLPFPNGGRGISITSDSSGNQIGGNTRILAELGGGDEESYGNTVAHNLGAGIEIAPDAGGGNLVASNSVFANAGLGIDFGSAGYTPNDPGDADAGPNNLQNHPVIVSKYVEDGDLLIEFKVDSAPEHSAYGSDGLYVEFFKADANGQGETFIGSAFYTLADYAGGSPGTKTVSLGPISSLGIDAGDPVTATATDAAGNTSEFLPPFAPSAAGVTVAGRVLAAGRPVYNAVVTLNGMDGAAFTARTNSFGYFLFPDVPSGQTYALTVSDRRFRFRPQMISPTDNITDLRLHADPQ